MPIGGSNRMGIGAPSIKIDPNLIPSLNAFGFFPDLCSIEERTLQQTEMGTVLYSWSPVEGMQKIPCLKFDRVPIRLGEEREGEIVENLKYWTIVLAGYYPTISSSWRLRMVGQRSLDDDSLDIFDIRGIESDSMHNYTEVFAEEYTPIAELGT